MGELPATFVEGFHDETVVRKMTYFPLGQTGLKVSKLALGTAGFSYLFGKVELEECKQIVLKALKSGINYIDTAPWYGHGESEEILGKCLEGIPRQAYYLATKVCRYDKDPAKMFNFSAENTRQSIDLSLKRLKLDYVDVLQIHDVDFAENVKKITHETLPVLEEARKAGKTRFIGITGYLLTFLEDCILNSPVKLDTVLVYARSTLLDGSLDEFVGKFRAKNLAVINAAVHSMGMLTNFGPQDWHPAGQNIRDISSEAREYCKKQGIELGKLALYFSLQKTIFDTNLVGINSLNLLDASLSVLFNGLTSQESDALNYLTKKVFSKLQVKHWEEDKVVTDCFPVVSNK